MKSKFIIIAIILSMSAVNLMAASGIKVICKEGTGICYTYMDENGVMVDVPGEYIEISTPQPNELNCGPTDVTLDNIFVHDGPTAGTGTGYEDGHGCAAQDGSQAVFEPATGVTVETDYTTWENSVNN